MHQLDRHGRADEVLGLGRRDTGGQTDQQRPQPLAAGGDRVAGVARQHRSVAVGELRHPALNPGHQPGYRLASRVEHRLHGHAHPDVTSPTWSAMMPPAVST